MKFQTQFIMDRIDYFLPVFQREYKKDSAEYHYFFALAMALSLHDLKDELELDEVIKTFIQNTPYQKKA